jgi:SEC-C motif-containing protein
MRSRFAAYALELVDYVMDTTDPSGAMWQSNRDAWREDLLGFTGVTEFRALRVIEAHETGDEAVVSFEATLKTPAGEQVMCERSRFVRRSGRWLYVEGVVAQPDGH